MRVLITALLLVAPSAFAQSEGSRWGLSTRFQGTFNDLGQILKLEPSVSYSMNPHLEVYAGLPLYMVKNPGNRFDTGVGNATLGAQLDMNNPVLHYTASLVATAPTGDRDKGFSTGHVTADWSNTFSHDFESVIPFGSFGVANTVSDTSFFVRPFSTDGLVTHFEGGGIFRLNRLFNAGASAYAIRARGDQQIVIREPAGRSGKIRTHVIQETANDHGASAWLSLQPAGNFIYQVGYSRSAAYDLNSLFFGISFRLN